jgi:heat shock protein beta
MFVYQQRYLNDEKLKELVHHYSEFITHPIFLLTTEKTQVPDEDEIIEMEKTDDAEVDEFDREDVAESTKVPKMKDVVTQAWNKVNAEGAIWTRPKEEISDEDPVHSRNYFKNNNSKKFKK